MLLTPKLMAISAGVSAVVSFGMGYALSDYFSDKTILKLTAEKVAANELAERERQRLTERARTSQEKADDAKKTLETYLSRPPVVTERVHRVRVPVVGMCQQPNGGGREADGNSDQQKIAGDTNRTIIPPGRYIRAEWYYAARDKLNEYRQQHKAHILLSEVVRTIEGVKIEE
ncbi:MAG: hypothetical protein ACRBC3_19620 [Burkholderiaceae bacterium]